MGSCGMTQGIGRKKSREWGSDHAVDTYIFGYYLWDTNQNRPQRLKNRYEKIIHFITYNSLSWADLIKYN